MPYREEPQEPIKIKPDEVVWAERILKTVFASIALIILGVFGWGLWKEPVLTILISVSIVFAVSCTWAVITLDAYYE